ncbi:SMI1/KNR4 family protein [Calothrix sp. PCC 6303]|uniref:SMI1/KNR4 family protein n=1 Tax=Calothrix sp. PCC 6303 TaxID=1170562 RepID=UPI0002A021F9|nr:SMI1/KNR4 family protein [Calothrix sp. PCC 6303]AFZ03292.1 Cell wall assembly/cell proliferation coordinating protein, KNR4 [Calothrix sp. PCC 6303]
MLESLEPVINRNVKKLNNKLIHLKELDKRCEFFGSESHKYKLKPCLSKLAIQQFEDQYQVKLPDDYRDFLLEVGNGGAGPGYGLLGIEINSFDSENPELKYLSQPFILTHEWNDLDLMQASHEEGNPVYFYPNFIQGTILVAEYGCGVEARLVITGSERGNIWIDDRTNEAGIYPLSPHCAAFFHDDPDIEADLYESIEEVKTALSFYDWYNDWLNRGISQVIRFG